MEDRQGTNLSANNDLAVLQHHYPNRGLWLRLCQSLWLNDKISFIASGWYLFPSGSSSREDYGAAIGGRTWDTDTQWWFVDGIFSLTPCAGFSVMAGLRYDSYTTRFKTPSDRSANVVSSPSDTADVILQSWIPLIGA